MQVQHLRQVEMNEWQDMDTMGSLCPSGTSSPQTATTDAGNAGGVLRTTPQCRNMFLLSPGVSEVEVL